VWQAIQAAEGERSRGNNSNFHKRARRHKRIKGDAVMFSAPQGRRPERGKFSRRRQRPVCPCSSSNRSSRRRATLISRFAGIRRPLREDFFKARRPKKQMISRFGARSSARPRWHAPLADAYAKAISPLARATLGRAGIGDQQVPAKPAGTLGGSVASRDYRPADLPGRLVARPRGARRISLNRFRR